MGLLQFLRRLLGGPSPVQRPPTDDRPHVQPSDGPREGINPFSGETQTFVPAQSRRVKLQPLRYKSSLVKTNPSAEQAGDTSPYRFARLSVNGDGYLDLSSDGDPRWLEHFGLPSLTTPEDLARFFDLKLGKLAWLTHRFDDGGRPQQQSGAHYHYHWLKKKTGGHRLIEAPKRTLHAVQSKILREILDRVPAHRSAHGFVRGRSIRTNAEPHVRQRVVLKFDLVNFYTSVKYSRVVAIFRSLGYSREVALWLARLTSSAIPYGMTFPSGDAAAVRTYYPRHLPQGAPTSPALANLSAFALDVRLAGLAQAYKVQYTRYADDLTFSGPCTFIPALKEFIPLTEQIIRSERFTVHWRKRKVLRNNKRQSVAGVVVNAKPNISREEYDRLKATLHNCVKQGPSTQNRTAHPEFAAHLLGRIAHVTHLNASRGARLRALYERIDWSR